MDVQIKIAKQINDFDLSWDNFLTDNHHLRSSHLKAFENAAIPDFEHNYVQVFLKNKLIGLIYLQQFQFRHKHLNFREQRSLISRVIQFVLPKSIPVLVCGHMFRIDFQGFYFKHTPHQSLLFESIELFLQQERSYKPSVIIIKDCEDAFLKSGIKFPGFSFFNGDVTMEITRKAHWITFEDYLNSLSNKYLKRANKIIKAFEPIEKKEFSAQEIAVNAIEIEKLYWNVVQKQSIRLGTVNASYFYELKKDLAQNFEFYALYKNKKMVGFYTLLLYEAHMETHYIGLDYETNSTCQLYFNILFLSVQKMIKHKFNKLELGRTSKEAKANLGAAPKQILNFIKINHIIARITITYFLKRFNTADQQKILNRNPFK